MTLAHQGMGITKADWGRFIETVTSVAGELGAEPTEGGEVMDFLNSLKTDICYRVDRETWLFRAAWVNHNFSY
jgi:hypothetical protein